jgi:hypothetical protein
LEGGRLLLKTFLHCGAVARGRHAGQQSAMDSMFLAQIQTVAPAFFEVDSITAAFELTFAESLTDCAE